MLRNPILTLARVVQMIAMGFFFCSVYFKINDDVTDPLSTFNRSGGLFFACATTFVPALLIQIVACKLPTPPILTRKSH